MLAQWYGQMASFLDAGLGIYEALRASSGPPKQGLARLAAEIDAGLPLPEVLERAPSWLPREDRPFLSAGSRTGRLSEMFGKLAERREAQAQRVARVVVGLVYPVLMAHVAVAAGAVAAQLEFGGDSTFQLSFERLFADIAVGIGALWALLLGLYGLYRLRSPILNRIGEFLPGFRGAVNAQNLADFASALGMLYASGVDIGLAWRMAGDVSQSLPIRRAAAAVSAHVEAGGAPTEVLAEHRVFPETLRTFYQTGERTGTLDTKLFQLAHILESNARTRLGVAITVYPTLVLLAVMLVAIFVIFNIFSGYLTQFQ